MINFESVINFLKDFYLGLKLGYDTVNINIMLSFLKVTPNKCNFRKPDMFERYQIPSIILTSQLISKQPKTDQGSL